MFSWVLTNTPRSVYTVFQPLCHKSVALPGIVVAEVQDPAHGLVEFHPIGLSAAVQHIQIHLSGFPTLRQINTFSHLGMTCKRTEGAVNLLIQVINKDIKQDGLQ